MLLSPCRRITLGRLRMVGLSSLLMRLEGEIKNYQGRGSACVKHDGKNEWVLPNMIR